MKESRATTSTSSSSLPLATSAASSSPNGTITGSSSKMTKCEQCAEYVRDIFLRRPESRPLEMLRAMGAITKPNSEDIHIHPVHNGMAVAIPSSLKQPSVASATTATTTTTTIESSTIQATSSLKNATATPASLLQSSLEKIVIMCRPCSDDGPEGHARSFMAGPNPSHVVLCSNRLDLSNRQEVEEVLIHELVHAYDAHVQQLDFTTCVGLAYSEVRAAREAECAHTWMMPGHCVKATAIRATNNMFPGLGRDCVQEVFGSAMADRRPIPFAATSGGGTTAASASTAASSAATATSPSVISTPNHHPNVDRHPRTRQPGYHRRNDNDSNFGNNNNNNLRLPRSLSVHQQQHSQR